MGVKRAVGIRGIERPSLAMLPRDNVYHAAQGIGAESNGPPLHTSIRSA